MPFSNEVNTPISVKKSGCCLGLSHKEDRSVTATSGSVDKFDGLVKMDPYRGSWGLRFLELELSNPTDVEFKISVSVQMEDAIEGSSSFSDQDASEYGYPKTKIDRDSSARVLIPLEHFKLPVLDGSFLVKDSQGDLASGSRSSSFSEQSAKAELNACIKSMISRIKVKWESGRNNSGELNIKDAMQSALQTTIMDDRYGSIKSMTSMEVSVRNNTKEMIKMNLSITCQRCCWRELC